MVRTLRAELGSEHGTIQRVAASWEVRGGIRCARGCAGRHRRGLHTGSPPSRHTRIRELEQENRELKRAQRDPETSGEFSSGRSSTANTQEIVAFIDAHRADFGVEPICTVLRSAGVQVAPSTYYAAKTRQPLSARAA